VTGDGGRMGRDRSSGYEWEALEILDSVLELIAYEDLELKVVWANRAACDSVGMVREELVGRYCYEVWAERTEPCADCPVLRAMETGEPQDVEKWTPDGRAWLIRGYPVRDEAGDIVGAIEVTLDITARKQAEQALKDSEELLRTILDTNPNAVFVVDREGHYILVNEAFAELYHTTPEEMLGKTARDWAEAGELETEHAEQFMAEDAVVIDSGEQRVTLGEPLAQPDGTAKWYQVIKVPLILGGDAKHMLGLLVDVTECKRAEEERERSLVAEREQRLRAETLSEVTLALTSQLSTDAILDEVLRQARRIVPYSAANIALLEGDTLRIVRTRGYELLGVEELVSGLVQPLATVPLDARAIEAREPLVISDTASEPEWQQVKGTEWIRSYLTVPICLGDRVFGMLRLDGDTVDAFSDEDASRLQPLVGAAAIALENAWLYEQARQEIVERKKAEEERAEMEAQLRQSAKMEAVGLLAGGIAHEFNNLLTVIRGNAELGRAQLEASHPLHKELSAIERTATRAAKLTYQLLAFGRRQMLQPQVLDVNLLVCNFAEMFQRSAGERVQVCMELDPDVGEIRADPNGVEQVLMNLAVNARDAMPEGGTLTLRTAAVVLDEVDCLRHGQVGAKPGQYVCVSVCDTGRDG